MNPGDTPRIALVTLGQTPRPDLMPDVLDLIGVEVAAEQHGALDGLAREEIARHPPGPRDRALFTRVGAGEDVVVSARFIAGRLAALVEKLDRRCFDLIALVSTGVYVGFAPRTPFVHGQRVSDAWIDAIVPGDCRIGVIYPLSRQVAQSPPLGHDTLIQGSRTIVSAGQGEGLADAARRLRGTDLVFMHSVGYGEAVARQVAAITRCPVVTARRVIAGAIRAQLSVLPRVLTATPPTSVALVDRLPEPTPPLTAREREVMELALHSHGNKAIGRALGISYRTVEIHRARALAKFGAASTTDLMLRAVLGVGS
jgi:protein AroM